MLRKLWRALPALFLVACTQTSETSLLYEGQPDDRVILPVVMREVAALAGPDVRRICIAQADDALNAALARPFEASIMEAIAAVDLRLSGDLRACRLQSWNDVPAPETRSAVAIYYRDGARWMLDMAARSAGGDGFDRSWFNDYLRRFKSGHALVFVRLDRSIHFFEVEPTARGPRIVGSDVQGEVAPQTEDSDSGDLG